MKNIYEIAVHVDKTIYIKIKAKSSDEAFDIYLNKMDDQCPIISKDEDIKVTEGKDYGGYLSTSCNGKVIDEE
jgi:hypothetical protein